MDISNEHYFNDYVDNDIRIFYYYDGKIGLENLKSGKKTMPSFDRVITSPHYIFVEVDELWGLIDNDLSIIVPPMCQKIYPVEKVDAECFISSCMKKGLNFNYIFDGDSICPTHIAIQNAEIKLDAISKGCTFNDSIDEADKAVLYKIIHEYDHLETCSFVLVTDEKQQIVDLDDNYIVTSKTHKTDFFFLWHYRENTFVNINVDNTYCFLTCRDGRFFKKSFISLSSSNGIMCDIDNCSEICFYQNDFVSVCLPEVFLVNGELNISGKWALFRLVHSHTGLWDWKEFNHKLELSFKQLTPFAFSEKFTQVFDGWGFVCKEMDKQWFVKYDKEIEESEHSFYICGDDTIKACKLVDKYLHSQLTPSLLEEFQKICFKGQLLKVVSHNYDSIDFREDEMFDIYTEDGYGLYDKNMQEIVPTKYDCPIEWGERLMLVRKNGKYGLINSHSQEVVPCCYDYVQVGKGRMNIWKCKTDSDTNKEEFCINNNIELNNDDIDLFKEGYCLVGITIEKKTVLNSNDNIFQKLYAISHNLDMIVNHCDVFSSNGNFIAKCTISKYGSISYLKEVGTLEVVDKVKGVNGEKYKRYGYYVNNSSSPILASEELSNNNEYLNGDSSEGYNELETIIITKDVKSVKWNGLGRYSFRGFEVVDDNKIFCEYEGVLYTKKGYNRNGKSDKKNMIELVACPTVIRSHTIVPGTKRIANCAFKGSRIERLNIPDSLEEIGANAFYFANNLKLLEIPISIHKIESQDVGKSGSPSPTIIYDNSTFNSWESLYSYMMEHGFEKNNGNIVRKKQ